VRPILNCLTPETKTKADKEAQAAKEANQKQKIE
jgi:hypothetical protein